MLLQDQVEENFAKQYQDFEGGKFSESATEFISSSWQGEALRKSQVGSSALLVCAGVEHFKLAMPKPQNPILLSLPACLQNRMKSIL